MIKDLCGTACLAAFLAILCFSSSAASAEPPALTPKPIACHKLQGNGRKVCDEKPGGARWKNGWWADPTKYRVIDANVATEMDWEIPFDGYKSFSLNGHVGLNARKGFRGTLQFPRRKPGVSTSILIGKPARPFAMSEGGWSTKDGWFDCGVGEKVGEQYGPKNLVGVVAARPRAGEIGIQWGLWGAPIRCPSDAPVSNPTPPEIPSEALTTRYSVASFRKGDLLRLPVKASWVHKDEAYGGVFKLRLFGNVILKRDYHRIR